VKYNTQLFLSTAHVYIKQTCDPIIRTILICFLISSLVLCGPSRCISTLWGLLSRWWYTICIMYTARSFIDGHSTPHVASLIFPSFSATLINHQPENLHRICQVRALCWRIRRVRVRNRLSDDVANADSLISFTKHFLKPIPSSMRLSLIPPPREAPLNLPNDGNEEILFVSYCKPND